MDLSVVIPVYNNESTVSALRDLFFEVFEKEGVDFEIVFVNDASKDNSLSKLMQLSLLSDKVNVINLKKNVGQNMALMNGMKAAQGEKVLVMDADLQDDPNLIPQLLDKLKENDDSDAVFVLRKGMYQSGARMLTSVLFKQFLQIITGLNYKAGSYFVVRRNVVDAMISFKLKYPIVTVMVYAFSRKVRYLDGVRNHNEGSSSYSFLKRCHYAFRATYCAVECRIRIK